MEATRKDVISREELIKSTLPIKLPSPNFEMNDEINVEDNEEIENSQEENEDIEEIENSQEQIESNFGDLQNKRLKDIDKMFNPWLTKNHLHSEDEALLQVPTEDFEVKTIANTGCSIRAFKNASVYSSSEFIHEYIVYKKCIKEVKGSEIADWQKKITVKTGSKGQLIVDSTNTYGINPKSFCSNPKSNSDRSHASPKVLYLILSNHTEIEASMRDSIRSSWSIDINKTLSNNHKVIFFLGKTKNKFGSAHPNSKLKTGAKIMEEGKIYSDLVTTDVEEYDPQYNIKQTFAMLSWMYKYCEIARFVVITTSNSYVNLKTLEQFADQEMFAANRIYGSILKRMIPDRQEGGLHYISEEEWPWDYFPPFLKEPTFILSGDVVPRLLLAASITPQIRLDSVYIAGILPALIGLSRIEVNSFFSHSMPKTLSPIMIDNTNECLYGKFGMIHGVEKPVYMKQVDALIHDMRVRNVTCQVAPRCIAKVEGRCVLKSDEGDDEKDLNKKGSKKKKKSPLLKAGVKALGSLWGDKTAIFG